MDAFDEGVPRLSEDLAAVEALGPWVLASASPRRSDLLRAAGWSFIVQPADVDESPRDGEGAEELARRLALDKAAASAKAVALASGTVLAGDTVVVRDGAALGKPADRAEAGATLMSLSGRTHEVVSSVALHDLASGRAAVDLATSVVRFDDLDDATLARYLDGGEWRGKAGSYAIQGDAGVFAHLIAGDWDTVVGLPMTLVNELVTRWNRST